MEQVAARVTHSARIGLVSVLAGQLLASRVGRRRLSRRRSARCGGGSRLSRGEPPLVPCSPEQRWCCRRIKTTRPSGVASSWPRRRAAGSRSQWPWPPTDAVAGTRRRRGRHLPTSPRSATVNGIAPSMSWKWLDRIVSNFGFHDGELSDHESELADRIGDLLRSVRPSQVFVTRFGDPHPDHRTLTRAIRQAVAQTYDSGPGVPRGGLDGRISCPSHRTTASGIHVPRLSRRRIVARWSPVPGNRWHRSRAVRPLGPSYWPADGRCCSGPLGRCRRRLPQSVPTTVKVGSCLGELRYVWDTGVELYWPMDDAETG